MCRWQAVGPAISTLTSGMRTPRPSLRNTSIPASGIERGGFILSGYFDGVLRGRQRAGRFTDRGHAETLGGGDDALYCFRVCLAWRAVVERRFRVIFDGQLNPARFVVAKELRRQREGNINP